MAGGLSPRAGSTITVRTGVPDPQTGQVTQSTLVVDLRDLVKNPSAQALALRGGDSVFVPEAGTFFVEGAVDKPGSFPLQPDMTVLKAVAVAGGTKWEASDNKVRIIRRDGTGMPKEMFVDLAAVKERGQTDLRIEDGDVVVVDTNKLKKGTVVVWDTTFQVLTLGRWYW